MNCGYEIKGAMILAVMNAIFGIAFITARIIALLDFISAVHI